MLLEVYQL